MTARKNLDGTAVVEPAPCGTYAAHERHKRLGEPICDSCAEARNVYMRAYRAQKPAAYLRDRERQYARDRAMRRLADRWPRMFERLLKEELNNAPP